jgi:hypothetical protein
VVRLASCTLLVASLAACATEHARWVSPDGRFDVVVHAAPRLFAMPGGGSDGAGEVEIVRRADGVSCGSAPVDMAWMAHDVAFDASGAHLRLVADWDLAACHVTLLPR